jgi:hypothetical protein
MGNCENKNYLCAEETVQSRDGWKHRLDELLRPSCQAHGVFGGIPLPSCYRILINSPEVLCLLRYG